MSKTAKLDRRTRVVARFPNGAKVERKYDYFFAYDAAKNFLGWTNDQAKAESAARHGHPISARVDEANELSLWLMWNDAVDAGARVMADVDGHQIIALPDDVFILAKDSDTGWTTELVTDVEFEERYYSDAAGCYDLHVVNEGKFRLE